MRLFLLLLLGSLLTVGCGQKGPLYKTPEAEVNQPDSEPVVTAETPQSPQQAQEKQQ